VQDIRILTPTQAMAVSVRLVIALTKYDENAASRADESTALEILHEGRVHQRSQDAGWTGNGVCRNIASCVKAVFDCIGAHELIHPNDDFQRTLIYACLANADEGRNFLESDCNLRKRAREATPKSARGALEECPSIRDSSFTGKCRSAIPFLLTAIVQ